MAAVAPPSNDFMHEEIGFEETLDGTLIEELPSMSYPQPTMTEEAPP
eukprot:CAMPEP_0118718248 /NCGR_PEP_ID=MMETSP0800-20121206/28688_1 /TAXON_ID=210618 ORGANISM="Striatella unipunctata, Strain CCMP2910" /NCGR_SAMPLE_ID=MMETSP0800 /ASSEMBLY_ACC=CAM_ASM_000638 /LENGTH=46 /DNA_ID= /DNA_START= /DNA_END= /DNA_ORIENTATION=